MDNPKNIVYKSRQITNLNLRFQKLIHVIQCKMTERKFSCAIIILNIIIF